MRNVPPTSIEVGDAFGTTTRQRLRLVQVPLAKPSIMLGVNQTIMAALSIVVIAAFVSAGGLGRSVLDALQRTDPGQALEAGIAIVRPRDHPRSRDDRLEPAQPSPDQAAADRGVGRVAALGRSPAPIGVSVLAVLIGREVLRQQEFPPAWDTTFVASIANQVIEWSQTTLHGFTRDVNDFADHPCWIRSSICSSRSPGGSSRAPSRCSRGASRRGGWRSA